MQYKCGTILVLEIPFRLFNYHIVLAQDSLTQNVVLKHLQKSIPTFTEHINGALKK